MGKIMDTILALVIIVALLVYSGFASIMWMKLRALCIKAGIDIPINITPQELLAMIISILEMLGKTQQGRDAYEVFYKTIKDGLESHYAIPWEPLDKPTEPPKPAEK